MRPHLTLSNQRVCNLAIMPPKFTRFLSLVADYSPLSLVGRMDIALKTKVSNGKRKPIAALRGRARVAAGPLAGMVSQSTFIKRRRDLQVPAGVCAWSWTGQRGEGTASDSVCQYDHSHVSPSMKPSPPTTPPPLPPASMQSPVLSTCPLHTNSGCGKERRIFIGPW